MKTASPLIIERREAAASIKWPARTAFLMNPDPAVREKLAKLVLGVVVFFGVASAASSAFDAWTKSQHTNNMRPAMEVAMKAGNRTAGTWLATNFETDYPGLLEEEANAGEPNAMFDVGAALAEAPHPERFFKSALDMTPEARHAKALELLHKAAAAGNVNAVKYLAQHGGA